MGQLPSVVVALVKRAIDTGLTSSILGEPLHPDHPRVAAFLERLYRQQPTAVIYYGSSMRPDDFIEGASDFDLIVLSTEPLLDVENDINCEYFFMTPNEFVSRLASGNMFWISALQTGRVLFDPQGFMSSLRMLIASGLSLDTNLTTLRNALAVVLRQLGAALNVYFSGQRRPSDVRAIRQHLYSACKGLGAYHAIAASGVDPHGFQAIARAVPDERLAELMHRTRATLLREIAKPTQMADTSTVRVEGDQLGKEILEIEDAVLQSVSLLPGRRATNDVIASYLGLGQSLSRTLGVLFDDTLNQHLVVGQSADRYRVFGWRGLRNLRGTFVTYEFADLDDVSKFAGAIKGLRLLTH